MVKEFLEKVRKDFIAIEAKKRQIEVTKGKLLQGVNFEEKSASCNASDQLNKITINVLKMEEELNMQIANIMEDRVEATRIIASITNPSAMDIVSRRYLENQEWEKIQKETGYSYRQVFRLCKQAYTEIEQRWH